MSFPEQSRQTYLDYSETAEIQATLPRFFNLVYTWMFVGLAVTATVAMLGSRSTMVMQFLTTPYMPLAVVLGAFAFAWVLQSNIEKLSPTTALLGFLGYSAIIGLLLSAVPLVYDMSTVMMAFGVTTGYFLILSVFGFITKKDLSSVGSIAVVGALGLFAISIFNVFMKSDLIGWLVTYGILIVFTVITAYQTQKLKEIAYATAGDSKATARYAVLGSMILYGSFLNLFLAILRIMGGRK